MSDDKTSLEVILCQEKVPTVKEEELLGVMSPENREFYDRTTRVNFSLPDITDVVSGTIAGGEFYDAMASLSDRVHDHMDEYVARRRKPGETLRRLFAHYIGRHSKNGKTPADLDREEESRARARHARFMADVYDEIKNEIGPAHKRHMASLYREFAEKMEIILGAEEIINDFDRYLTQATQGIQELEAGLEEIEEGVAEEYVRKQIQELDRSRNEYAVAIHNLVRYDIPAARRDAEMLQEDIEYHGEFMRVAPQILLDFQERVRQGRHGVARYIRNQANQLLYEIQRMNESEPLSPEEGRDERDPLLELRAFAEVLDATRQKGK